MEQFQRTELLLGKDGMNALQNAHVSVFGVGGVGSYAVEGLVRSGIGEISLFDNDVVSISNINRQLIALYDTVGIPKVEAAKERALNINPTIKVNPHQMFYSAETAESVDLSQFDYIVDAIDTVSSKLLLIETAVRLGVPIISSMGTGNKLNPAMLEVTDIYKTSVCPLARVMRYELRKRRIKRLKVVYSKEEPIKAVVEDESSTRHAPGSTAFVPGTAGLIIASEIVREISGR